MKSLASKVKSLAIASKPQILNNCSVLGSKSALFFELLKFCWKNAKNLAGNLRKPFLLSSIGDRLKNFFEGVLFLFFIFREHQRLCPWPLASSIPVLSLERVCPRKGCPWPRIFYVFLASNLVSSTPHLLIAFRCH